MKIAIDHSAPFLFAHGGFQIQIEQTRLALEKIGVQVEFLRWWDDGQRPDLIHYFGSVHSGYVEFAHRKGIKVVMSELRTGLGSRAPRLIALQALLTSLGRRMLPRVVLAMLRWDIYQTIDAATALTPWEAQLMREVLGAAPEKLRIIPNGVEEEFFDTTPEPPTEWLICTATIHPRKRVLELAQAAVLARTPVWIIGKPYSEDEPYHRAFLEVARAHPELIRYEGAIEDRRRLAAIYRGARGFVLISTMESLSLSALEAAASRCPLLLSDLPWARTSFGEHAMYCPNTSDPAQIALSLREAYNADRSARPHLIPLRWTDVARQLHALYAEVLAT